MQIHAFDGEGQIINARQASRHINYYCFECQNIVRLRYGPQRRPHFYHLEPPSFCRQHQKGAIHVQLQNYFLNNLPLHDCHLEYPFPVIRRIADVAWPSQKIIFEIQCSPISVEELLSRNRDYGQEGWKVVWILHEARFNRFRLSGAEMALRNSPHFFSNMDGHGRGIIYDQFDLWNKGMRSTSLAPLPIDFRGGVKFFSGTDRPTYPLHILNHRIQNWQISFKGDLIHMFENYPSSSYIEQVIRKEKQCCSSSNRFTGFRVLNRLYRLIVIPYQLFFRFLIEKVCR